MRRERARLSGVRGIVNYDWSPDGRSILVPLDGDLYLAGLDGNVRRITDTPETELDAQVSRTGRYLSFVRDQNLYVVDADGGGRAPPDRGRRRHDQLGLGRIRRAGGDGPQHRPLVVARTTRWLAVARVDEAPVHVVTRTAIGADGTRVYQQRYPGRRHAQCPGRALRDARRTARGRVKVDLGADPDIYLARVDWTADGGALLVQRESRDQKRLDLLSVDPATGRSTILFTETLGDLDQPQRQSASRCATAA